MRPFIGPDVDGFTTSVILGLGVLGFIFVTAAGFLFWRDPTQIRLMRWALAAQVPWISIPGLVYKFAAGLALSLSFVASHQGARYSAGFNSNFLGGSYFEFRIFQMAPVEIGVNVIALALFMLVLKPQQAERSSVQDESSCDREITSP